MTKLIIDISAHYVFFLQPKNSTEILVLLPVLAPMRNMQPSSYTNFLESFTHAVANHHHVDEDGFVGLFQIHHELAVYQFVALTPLLNASLKAKSIMVVPYCAAEGYPGEDAKGVYVEVLSQKDLHS